MPHPVRFIGWLIKKTEKYLRAAIKNINLDKAGETARNERIAGFILAFFVVSTVFVLVFLILKAAIIINAALFHILNIYFIYSSLATKCLAVEGGKVYRELKGENLQKARRCIGMLVSRQTENLSENDIVRACVETVAENTVDGVVSPLVYALAGTVFGIGAPLAYAFKAISTLDSMVGYKNEKYLNLGFASAKIDDGANYFPARLTGVIIPLSAALLGMSFKRSFSILLRDRRNHKSPNCAYPESAVAGALGVMLGGSSVYFGKIEDKPTIGDNIKPLEAEDIIKTNKLMFLTSFIVLVLGALMFVLRGRF